MSGVSIEAFMVFLSLKNVDQVPALDRDRCDVVNVVLTLFFMIWRVWNFEFLLISCVVHLHEAELRKAMFITNSIKTKTPDLNSYRTFARSPWVNLGEPRLLDDIFLHSLLNMSIPLGSLFLPQLHHFERPHYSTDRDSERIKSHKLAHVTIKFEFEAYFRLTH